MQKKCIQLTLLKQIQNFVLSLHYNGANSYLFVNGTVTINSNQKDSKTLATPLCLRNISKYFSVDNMKKKQDYMDMLKILVLTIGLLPLMIY